MAWGDNVRRLFGVHDLTNSEAADLLGFSQQAVSEWVSKTRKEPRQPSLATVLKVAEFFQVNGHRLVEADFDDLLSDELADAERYREVEAEIRRRRSTLREVGDTKMFGKVPKKVIAMHKADEAMTKRRSRSTSKSADKATGGENGSA